MIEALIAGRNKERRHHSTKSSSRRRMSSVVLQAVSRRARSWSSRRSGRSLQAAVQKSQAARAFHGCAVGNAAAQTNVNAGSDATTVNGQCVAESSEMGATATTSAADEVEPFPKSHHTLWNAMMTVKDVPANHEETGSGNQLADAVRACGAARGSASPSEEGDGSHPEGWELAHAEMKMRRASRIQRDVLGIFHPETGGDSCRVVDVPPALGDAHSHSIRTDSGHHIDAETRWQQAQLIAQHEVLAKRWHRDVNRNYKRLWHAFKDSHTLMAGLIFRATGGYTRAQTVMVLVNSLALEITILCMFYQAPSDGPLVINPVAIIVSGMTAAAICIPGMLILTWLFNPIIFLRVGKWMLHSIACCPCIVHSTTRKCCAWLCIKTVRQKKTSVRALPAHQSSTRVMPTRLNGSTGEIPSPPSSPPECSSSPGDTSEACAPASSEIMEVVGADLDATPPVPAKMTRFSADVVPPGAESAHVEQQPGGSAQSTPTSHAMRRSRSLGGSRRLGLTRTPSTSRTMMRSVSFGGDKRRLQRAASAGRSLMRSASLEGSSKFRVALRRAVSYVTPTPTTHHYSYDSLNEHMLGQSLTRSIATRNWRAVARISLGWTLSFVGFFGMLFVFALYACELFSAESTSNADWRALLLSWAFSVCQRFIVNEPMLILVSKGVPMLFTSELCANVCGETVVNLLDLFVQAIATCIKRIKVG